MSKLKGFFNWVLGLNPRPFVVSDIIQVKSLSETMQYAREVKACIDYERDAFAASLNVIRKPFKKSFIAYKLKVK